MSSVSPIFFFLEWKTKVVAYYVRSNSGHRSEHTAHKRLDEVTAYGRVYTRNLTYQLVGCRQIDHGRVNLLGPCSCGIRVLWLIGMSDKKKTLRTTGTSKEQLEKVLM